MLEGVKCNDAFMCAIPRFELLYTTVNSVIYGGNLG